MIQPDNFLYFITLFSLAIFGGTYLLFTYYINRLLILNVIIFFLSAIRLATEYYLPQVEIFEQASLLAEFHVIPVNTLIPLQWICIWLYIRPVKGWKWENYANNFFIYGLCIIPFWAHNYYTSIDRQIFYFAQEKIDGYWQFAINTDFWYYPIYRNHVDWTLLLIALVLLYGVIRDKKNRFTRLFLFISYLIFPYLYYSMTTHDEWNIPTTGILYLGHTLIISWYISDYRLFRSNFSLYTKDLFNSISDLIISTNQNLQIDNFNEKAKQIFNLQSKNFIQLLKAHTSLETATIEKYIDDLITKNIEEVEISLLDREAHNKTFSLKVAPFQKNDIVLGYTFLLTDLTEIKQKEQELRSLNETKDRLFAIIGHDLRRPALAFRGIGKKINYLIHKKDYNTLNQLSETLEKSAFSLNSLLDNLLNWALQQRNILPYHPQPIDIEVATVEICELFEEMAKEKNIDLSLNLEESATVFTDPNALNTVFRNLLDNAIKFTPQGGKIEIHSAVEEEQLLLQFKDTGVGMSKSELDTLFELKKDKSKRGTKGEAGSGLGLLLVKDLLQLNKGSIKVKSQPNIGTTFDVFLPLAT